MENTLKILNTSKPYPAYVNALIIVGSVLMFIFSIQLMGLAFTTLGHQTAQSIIEVTSNPFIGLFIGLLITALLQSSSTTTSLVVAAVASNSIPLQHAVPIVMGANVGTTITSTIVSLGYITNTNEFRKAISAGTVHDIFNILVVLILFPLEVNYQLLTKISTSISGLIKSSDSLSGSFFNGGFLKLLDPIGNRLLEWFGPVALIIIFCSTTIHYDQSHFFLPIQKVDRSG